MFLVNAMTRRMMFLILADSCALSPTAFLYVQVGAKTQEFPEYSDSAGYQALSALRGYEQYSGGPFLRIRSATPSGMEADGFAPRGKIADEFKSSARNYIIGNKRSRRLLERFARLFSDSFADQVKKEPAPPIPTESELGSPPDTAYQASAVGFDVSHHHPLAVFAAGGGCEAGRGPLLGKNRCGSREIQGSPDCEWMSFNVQDRTNKGFS